VREGSRRRNFFRAIILWNLERGTKSAIESRFGLQDKRKPVCPAAVTIL
jgi:hypothetical protein